MDKQYAINLIRELFENPFSKEKFTIFIKNLLNHIEDASFVYRGAYIPGIYQEDVKTIERIGKYQDVNGKQLDILIVTFLRDETLERARSLQRNIIAWYLNGGRGGKMKDAALVAFISPNNQDWRFSFVKMEYKYDSEAKKIKESYTPAKRYSYLVGPHEASHTAQSMMIPVLLNDKINPTLEEIEAIFKIEKVTKEFFEKYKDLFLNLADQFKNNQEFEEKVVKEYSVNVADFVKKLMGQIVFLYFLQKKGWLGVKRDGKWGSGDKKFMHNLFDERYCKYKNFYNDVLEPLFYDSLNNRDRGNSSVVNDQSYSLYFDCRIPYLNGGLFTPVYDWIKSKIFIDNKYFQDIFDTFDTFNFTVFESDPIEKEVAVDPEMLGKVFENLLEVIDRKSKGAFYTPREIVHYMCQESLISYLISQSGYPEKRIRDLMKSKDQEVGRTEKDREKIENMQDLKDVADVVNNLLIEIRVCDPAVGSGAFPMGLLKEISSIRYFLNNHFLKKENKHKKLLTEYDIKKETLENCIYGVDIDPGAVEIARLRFWLALVVEHEIEDIEPLPNLDYKIMQGNSLIELLSPSLLTKTIDRDRNKIIEQLTIAKSEYFNLSDSLTKSNKREEINLLIRHIVNYDKGKQRENIWQNIVDIRSQLNLFGKQKNIDQLNIGDVTSEKISKELKELHKIENVSNSEHFEWHLNFNEVFEKGGFNIVIGNPPYIHLQKFKGNPIQLVYENSKFLTHDKSGDIYCLFYEKGLHLTKNENGLLCFITSNKWMRAGYGKQLRKFLSNKNPLILIDLGPGIFDSATVDTNILLIQNNNNTSKLRALTLTKDLTDISQAIKNKAITLPIPHNGPWFIGSTAEIELKIKIETMGVPLKDCNVNINYGIKTGLNEAFVIDNNIKEKLCLDEPKSINILKPLLRGRDIKRYFYSWKGLWLIQTDYSIDVLHDYPAIFNHLKQFEDKAKKRDDQGKNWWNLRSCAYYSEFEKEKIIWQEISSEPTFSYDSDGFFCNDTARIFTGSRIKFYVGLFNSLFFKFAFSNWYAGGGLGEKGIRFKSEFMKDFPIPLMTQTNEPDISSIESLVNQIVFLKKTDINRNTFSFERQIDILIYKLYQLTKDEIKIVEQNNENK